MAASLPTRVERSHPAKRSLILERVNFEAILAGRGTSRAARCRGGPDRSRGAARARAVGVEATAPRAGGDGAGGPRSGRAGGARSPTRRTRGPRGADRTTIWELERRPRTAFAGTAGTGGLLPLRSLRRDADHVPRHPPSRDLGGRRVAPQAADARRGGTRSRACCAGIERAGVETLLADGSQPRGALRERELVTMPFDLGGSAPPCAAAARWSAGLGNRAMAFAAGAVVLPRRGSAAGTGSERSSARLDARRAGGWEELHAAIAAAHDAWMRPYPWAHEIPIRSPLPRAARCGGLAVPAGRPRRMARCRLCRRPARIRAIVAEHERGFNEKDPERLAAHYRERSWACRRAGVEVEGRAAMRAGAGRAARALRARARRVPRRRRGDHARVRLRDDGGSVQRSTSATR